MLLIRPIQGELQIFRSQKQLHKQMIAKLLPFGLVSIEYGKEVIKFLTQWISHFQNIRIILRWYLTNQTHDSFFNQLALPSNHVFVHFYIYIYI